MAKPMFSPKVLLVIVFAIVESLVLDFDSIVEIKQ